MRHPRRRSALLRAVLLALLLAPAGCGGDDAPTQPAPPAGGFTPGNDTALNTIRRFQKVYAAQALPEYLALLTADFHYKFSPDADPNLVTQYGTTWGVLRDSASTRHLFEGFTNGFGEFVPGADSIALSLSFGVYPNHADPDSFPYYAAADISSGLLEIHIAGTDGYAVPTACRIWLVRGDAAWLRPGQPADANHWYIQRWEDTSGPVLAREPGPMASAGTQAATTTTWGRLKAVYE